MKNKLIYILQSLLGFEKYLFWFTILKIKTIRWDSRKSDYVFFNKILQPDANIVVIGACTGITTIPFALRYPDRHIWAFEPMPTNYITLMKIVNYFNCTNISIFPIGIGNHEGIEPMILPIVNGVKKHGMAHIDADFIKEYREGISFNIKLCKADDQANLKKINIHALKIVAENYELPIFEGSQQLIIKNRPIIYCELWHNDNRYRVLDFIQSLNYKVFFRKNTELIEFNHNNYSGKNFIFKPINE